MVEVIRISNEVDVHIGRCSNRLPALSPADYLLELGASSLDLSTSILRLLHSFIRVLLHEVVVAGEDGASLVGEVCPLELLSFFNALVVLLLLLLEVIFVKTGRLVEGDRLVPLCNRWLLAA